MDKRKVLENCNNSIFKTKTNSFSQINKQGSCIKNRIKNRNNFEIPTLYVTNRGKIQKYFIHSLSCLAIYYPAYKVPRVYFFFLF